MELAADSNYQRATVDSVYAGIDLFYYGNEQNIEFDFEVSPAADPVLIRLDVAGADELFLNKA